MDGWTNKILTSTADGDGRLIFSDLSTVSNGSSLFGLTTDHGQYMATLRDGRIFLLSASGAVSRVMEVGGGQNCMELFAIVTKHAQGDVKGTGY